MIANIALLANVRLVMMIIYKICALRRLAFGDYAVQLNPVSIDSLEANTAFKKVLY